jgi:hypothetical protein
MIDGGCLRSEEIGYTSLSFWYLVMLIGFCEHCKTDKILERWFLDFKKKLIISQLRHASIMACWTLGFWNAMATSGLAMIFEITSSGVRPIWSAKHKWPENQMVRKKADFLIIGYQM